jgi:hypothetical protein
MLVFVIGAVLLLIGMATDRTWLVLVAAGVLAAGLVLRFIPRSRDARGPFDDDTLDTLDDDAFDDEFDDDALDDDAHRSGHAQDPGDATPPPPRDRPAEP